MIPKIYDLSITLNTGEQHEMLNVSKRGLGLITEIIKDRLPDAIVVKEMSYGTRLYGVVRDTSPTLSQRTSIVSAVVLLAILGILALTLYIAD